MFKNLFRFQIKPDDIKVKLDIRKARKNEEYSQYLADNNLQDTYAPANGKIFFLKRVLFISMANALFFFGIKICLQELVYSYYFCVIVLMVLFRSLFLILNLAIQNICKI